MAAASAPRAPKGTKRTLARGVLVFRWVSLGWMTIIAATHPDGFTRPELAWGSIGAVAAWTVWLTIDRRRWGGWILWVDVALSAWLLVASGLVVERGTIITGRPLLASGYPLSPVFLWAVTRGLAGGLSAAAVLTVAVVISRLVNGVSLGAVPASDIQNLAGTIVNFFVAGGAVGLVSRLVVQSAEEAQFANTALLVEREHAARLAERETLARQIHDSVLQALALVHKRGRQLVERGEVSIQEVAELAGMARHQEAQLRNLILRPPEATPQGFASLRENLEAVAQAVDGPTPTVSSVGPIWLDQSRVDEIGAAAREALVNVSKHAHATRTSVFADEEDGYVAVTVRDNGIGFIYDEERLREEGKAGMLKSIKGRIVDLGGTMTVTSAPGKGTEIELQVPKPKNPTT